MTQLIFINLPVADLDRSVAFYEAVGATKNPMFSDETAACMVLSDVINVMLLTHDKWRSFTDRAIPDAQVSALNPGGSLNLLVGSWSAAVGIGNAGTFFMKRDNHPKCLRSNQPNIKVGLNTGQAIPLANTSFSWAILVLV
jgi:hypothetical protein